MNRRKFLKFFGLGAVATVVPVKLTASEPGVLIHKTSSIGISTSFPLIQANQLTFKAVRLNQYALYTREISRLENEKLQSGAQWSPAERAILEKRKAQLLEINRSIMGAR